MKRQFATVAAVAALALGSEFAARAQVCQAVVPASTTVFGSWTSSCASAHRPGRYAKYYTFTVTAAVTFQADLVSAADAYLYLLSGSGSGGSVLAQDDDSGDGNSARISRTLSAGTYTLEATTYNSGLTGSFTLALRANGGSGGTCQSSVSGNSTTAGSWTSSCASAHRLGRYAKYYTFTINEAVTFQADLASANDAYLYLLSGSGSGGSVLAQDDDSGDGSYARISRTLSAGTYTIEATTYSSGLTGSFTLTLRATTAASCQSSVSGNSTTSASWTSGCPSVHRPGRYARYYTFTVTESVAFQADLASAADSYLYLLSGSGNSGSVLAQDDDSGDGSYARISRTLSAGTYTIEATTYGSGLTGSFTLTLRATTAASCQSSVSANSTTSGSWTSGCASLHRPGRYARYYVFTVTESVTFQADLVSATDSYLYLLSGSGSGGSVLTQDDDGAGSNNARISRTLSAGTYTIEATTYSSELTGSFTLTLRATTAADRLACVIFVHGSRDADGAAGYDWADNWQAGRDYWMEKHVPYTLLPPHQDFIRTATNSFSRPHYVVRYDGADAWWSTDAAGQVAREIVRATDGLADGGGTNRCRISAQNGGTFWVVTHSGGANVMDYILGNSRPSDPNFNKTGPYDVATARISGVFSVGGSHRGSPLADIICDQQDSRCPQLGKSCTTARSWLRTPDAYQVSRFASSPAKLVWLTGGYDGVGPCPGALPGEDDAVLTYASQFACSGDPLASFTNSTVCDNTSKQESSNLRNLDGAYENHDDEKNDYNPSANRERRSIPTGIWNCDGVRCTANTRVSVNFSTAALVDLLLRELYGKSEASGSDLPSLRRTTAEAYRNQARYPSASAPLRDGEDPLLRADRATSLTVRGPEGDEPSLTIGPAAVSFEAPEPIILRAYLREGDRRVPAVYLTGVMADAEGRSIASLDFHDDGEAGDEQAGDRVYAAVFSPPAEQARSLAGIHTVTVQAVTAGGVSRVGTTAVHYSAPDAQLTGRFDDRLVDGSLQIRAQVAVTAAGRFHLEGTLYTSDGRPVAWAQEAGELSVGRHWIPLSFYGLALSEMGADGPYVLRYVKLTTTTTMPNSPNRLRENAHVTGVYRAAEFTSSPFNDPELLTESHRLLQLAVPEH